MKVSIIILLLISFVQISYAKQLDEQQIALLEGNYILISAVENVGECPLKLATEYKWEESLDLAQIYLFDVTNEGKYFQDLSYVHRKNYSEFEKEGIFPDFTKRRMYKTSVTETETGFVLIYTYKRQTRTNPLSREWKTWQGLDAKLTLKNDIQGDSLLISTKKTQREDVLLDLECQYGKIK